MEDTHGDLFNDTYKLYNIGVLILIIMEDTHGGPFIYSQKRLRQGVLILIIMEDTHGVMGLGYFCLLLSSLNPYYNGRYSWRVRTHISLKTK